MASFLGRARFRILTIKYRGGGEVIVQAEYLGGRLLVRAKEDVGKLILAKSFETEELGYLLGQIHSEDIFFDVGANVGLFSVLVARRHATIVVHAFEPITLNAALCEASACINELTNVKVNRVCVGDTNGEIEFGIAADSAYSSIMDTGYKPVVRRVRVPVTTLDHYVAEQAVARIDVLKVDVEGAERMVLSGGARLLSDPDRGPRLVLLELWESHLAVFGTSVAEVAALMASWGYSGFVLQGGERVALQDRTDLSIYNVFFERRRCR